MDSNGMHAVKVIYMYNIHCSFSNTSNTFWKYVCHISNFFLTSRIQKSKYVCVCTKLIFISIKMIFHFLWAAIANAKNSNEVWQILLCTFDAYHPNNKGMKRMWYVSHTYSIQWLFQLLKKKVDKKSEVKKRPKLKTYN